MQGESRPLYAHRLNRDISDLFNHNFHCSSSTLEVTMDTSTVYDQHDQFRIDSSICLNVRIFEGPYRGGIFSFRLQIPENYPFKAVEVWAKHPIWHPNVDLCSGKVALPVEWAPVLTLNSLALAVQMILLEPSSGNPLNLESYQLYLSNSQTFDAHVQRSLRGGYICNGVFLPCLLDGTEESFHDNVNDHASDEKAVDPNMYLLHNNNNNEMTISPHIIGSTSFKNSLILEEQLDNDDDSHSSMHMHDQLVIFDQSTSMKRKKRERDDEQQQNYLGDDIIYGCNVAEAYSQLSLNNSNNNSYNNSNDLHTLHHNNPFFIDPNQPKTFAPKKSRS
eukprot:gene15437-20826_t